ncbi:MAG TPA: hypothetical protein VNX70_02985, partial [Bryobacteraceae bacterium]|nr:hypothetical protein [Bryobacteraceae bacterium]
MSLEVVNVGLLPAFFSAEKGLDFVVGENEAIVSGLVRKIFVFVHFQNLTGLVELTLFVCAAVGLDLAELSEGALELTGKALAVNADVGEGTHVFTNAKAMARAASASGWLTRRRSSISMRPSEKRLVSTAAARFMRQEVSMRDWTSWVSVASLGRYSAKKDL